MQETNENIVFCSQCGQKNNKAASFCSACGSRLNEDATSKQSTYTIKNEHVNYSDNMDEINLFLEKNQMFYQDNFNKIIKTGDKKTWNWSAFFLSIYWMLYRKMYLQAGGLLLLNIMTSVIPYIGWILSIALWICVGMYSNSLYLDHIRKKLNEINILNYKDKEMMIMQKGGTNLVLPVSIAVGFVVIGIIILMFIASLFGSMRYFY